MALSQDLAPAVAEKPQPVLHDAVRPLEKVGADTAHTNLGPQDLASVVAASRAHASIAGGEQLPDLRLPVALDKEVSAAHDELSNRAEGQLSPADYQQFRSNMAAFEKRADEDSLSPSQIRDTYGQLGRMLEGGPQSPFSAQQRSQLAGQWMDRLADPTDNLRQGWHDTCGWAYLEAKLLTNDPEKISKKMAEVITTGGASTLDANQVFEMATGRKSDTPVPTRVMKIDPSSLEPDQEAQGVSPHSDNRNYVDQLAQVLLDNINWDAKTTTPSGESIAPGSMHYDQCQSISRPSDGRPVGTGRDESCESVSYIDPKTGAKVVNDDHGYGFGGLSDSNDLSYVNAVVTGRFEKVLLNRTENGPTEDARTSTGVDSPEALRQQIQGFHDKKQLPMGVIVEPDHPGVMEDYLARHPEKNASNVPKNSWHIMFITGLDPQGNVQMYNPWGVKRTLTVDQLYEAMGYPQ
jgi:hypothetical protein